MDAGIDKIIFGVKTMSASLDGVEFKTEGAIIGMCFGSRVYLSVYAAAR